MTPNPTPRPSEAGTLTAQQEAQLLVAKINLCTDAEGETLVRELIDRVIIMARKPTPPPAAPQEGATPRTDEEKAVRYLGDEPHEFVSADFARTLERELNALTPLLAAKEVEIAIHRRAWAQGQDAVHRLTPEIHELQKQLTASEARVKELEAERDSLKYPTMVPTGAFSAEDYHKMKEIITALRARLAELEAELKIAREREPLEGWHKSYLGLQGDNAILLKGRTHLTAELVRMTMHGINVGRPLISDPVNPSIAMDASFALKALDEYGDKEQVEKTTALTYTRQDVAAALKGRLQ